ncbi:unnamed protein product, partial [Musa textilis]
FFFFQCFPSLSSHWITEGRRFDSCCSEGEESHIEEIMKVLPNSIFFLLEIEGSFHGEMDEAYDLEKVENTKIDLHGSCCGDFRWAVGNENDLESLSCPPKYQSMNSFWKYYSGQEVAPVPTIVSGGNHYASKYLWEL